MSTKQPITAALIYDMASKGILLYRASPSHIRFKIDLSMTTQRPRLDDNRMQARIAQNHAIIDACLSNMEQELMAKLENDECQLSKHEWALVKLWKLIDFTPIEEYLVSSQIVESSHLRDGAFTELDYERIAAVLPDMAVQFPQITIKLFLSYCDSTEKAVMMPQRQPVITPIPQITPDVVKLNTNT